VSRFLESIGYKPIETDRLSPYETKYLTGDWLDEYVGNKIKKELFLSSDELLVGVTLSKDKGKEPLNDVQKLLGEGVRLSGTGPDNEIDVMFIYKNEFYTIECKTSIINRVENGMQPDGTRKFKESNILGETIYKVDYLKNRFGLKAKSVILTLTSFNHYVTEPGNPVERNNRTKQMEDLINRCNFSDIRLIDRNLLMSTDKLASLIISR
jgi:hypothetical protein